MSLSVTHNNTDGGAAKAVLGLAATVPLPFYKMAASSITLLILFMMNL